MGLFRKQFELKKITVTREGQDAFINALKHGTGPLNGRQVIEHQMSFLGATDNKSSN